MTEIRDNRTWAAERPLIIFVVVVRHKDGGSGWQLRDVKAATRPLAQSAKADNPSRARRDAERIFGRLDWIDRDAAGLSGQPFVESVAQVEVRGIAW